jgi:hypothetical protein
MFTGTYEYMGFVIYNGDSKHLWDIEPLNWSIKASERFKSQSESFKTLAQAKKWIEENAGKIKESNYN